MGIRRDKQRRQTDSFKRGTRSPGIRLVRPGGIELNKPAGVPIAVETSKGGRAKRAGPGCELLNLASDLFGVDLAKVIGFRHLDVPLVRPKQGPKLVEVAQARPLNNRRSDA